MSAPAAHPPHETNGSGLKLEVGRKALPIVAAILLSGGGTATLLEVFRGPPARAAPVEPDLTTRVAVLETQRSERDKHVVDALNRLSGEVEQLGGKQEDMRDVLTRLCLAVTPRRGGRNPCEER